jgi:hypothetical protein
MRIDISFKDVQTNETEHRALTAVRTFINDRLGDKYYGPGMTWLDVSILSGARPGRQLKRYRKYKGSFAEHVLLEVQAEFGPPDALSPADFQRALSLIETCVGDSRDCWNGEFRWDAFRADLRELVPLAPTTAAEMKQYANPSPSLVQRIALKELQSCEQHRIENPKPRNKPLGGIRCYPSGRLEGALGPYVDTYCRLFEGLLRAERWMMPGYVEIYVNVDESEELVRLNRSALESWHENAYAVIRLEDFQNKAADPAAKQALVFDAFCRALRELARIDHLDANVLESVIARIAQSGLDTDLVYLHRESDTHRARILYRLSESAGTPAYRLEVVEKSGAGRRVERALEVRADEELWLAYRFGSLELTRTEVRIKARKGERAEVSLAGSKRPHVLVFKLAELFPTADS